MNSSRKRSASVVQVYVFRGGELLGTEMFSQPEIVVGRDPDRADLVLASEDVSRAHAKLLIRGGQVTLVDLESTNGVYLNGERHRRGIVEPADEVMLGDHMIKVRVMRRRRPVAPQRPRRERRRPAHRAAKPASESGKSFVPAFSLTAQLMEEDARVLERGDGARLPVVEVLTVAQRGLRGADLVRRGKSFWVGPKLGYFRRRATPDLPPRTRLIRLGRDGRAYVDISLGMRGRLQRADGSHLELEPSRADSKERSAAVLQLGDTLDVAHGDTRYHVRFTYPPVFRERRERGPSLFDERPLKQKIKTLPLWAKSVAGSSSFHVCALLVYWLVAGVGPAAQVANAEDSFATVVVEPVLTLEELEEPRPAQPVEEAPAEPQPQRTTRPQRTKRAAKSENAVGGAAGMLKRMLPKAGPVSAGESTSNLTRTRAPGARSGFKMSAALSAGPTSDITLGSGSGGPMLPGLKRRIRAGSGVGSLEGDGVGKVRGKVSIMSVPPIHPSPKAPGHLPRDAIQKVINERIGEIQRCYERELLNTPNLSGKVSMQWTIGASGRVVQTRQMRSTLNTPVVRCMQKRIAKWKFPPPSGGEVVVTYPFIFKAISF